MIKLENISYTYPGGGSNVINAVNCEITQGSAVLFTGASGCGKSTLIRAANGLIPHFFKGKNTGTVSISGKPTTQNSIPEIAREVGTLFQDPEQQFFTLDVESEIAFSHEQRGVQPETIRTVIKDIAEKLNITHILKSSLFSISEGEKQKTALASLLSLKPRAVLLDEPTANLDHASTLQLGNAIKELKNNGITVVIVDHRLYWLKDIVDKIFVLDHGSIAETGPFGLLENSTTRQKYGLRHADINHLHDTIAQIPSTESWAGKSVIIQDLSFSYKGKDKLFSNATFHFPMGHVTAIKGPNGRGKTTLARILTGLNKIKAGKIFLNDREITAGQLLKKAGLVFQNSDHQLFMNSVERELLISGRHLGRQKAGEKARHILQHFNLTDVIDAHPQSLSGGQKQRLVIACALMKEPDILILDEPTSGLDGANMQIISHTLKQIARRNTCVIVITHDLELIADSCDFILDLNQRKKESK